MSHILTAPPITTTAVDQEDGGRSFSGLVFLGNNPISGGLLTKAPDSCRDMWQFMKDLADPLRGNAACVERDLRAHKVLTSCRLRDTALPAHWRIHVKHAGDEQGGPCLMHVNLITPWVVKEFDDLAVYFEEIGTLISDLYSGRPCWDETFDFRDVTFDLVQRTDPTFEAV